MQFDYILFYLYILSVFIMNVRLNLGILSETSNFHMSTLPTSYRNYESSNTIWKANLLIMEINDLYLLLVYLSNKLFFFILLNWLCVLSSAKVAWLCFEIINVTTLCYPFPKFIISYHQYTKKLLIHIVLFK